MRNEELARMCKDLWEGLGEFRKNRERFKRYTYGDQWSDIVKTPDGHERVERDYLIESGDRPYTNNLIRQLVKSIVGRYRTERENKEKEEGKGEGEFARRNCLEELDSRMLEEFLISGAAIQRISEDNRGLYGRNREGKTRRWVDNVDPRRFFCNMGLDPRGMDVRVLGYIHDFTLRETVMRFSCGDSGKAAAIKKLYSMENRDGIFDEYGGEGFGSVDSFPAAGRGVNCRVIEMWSLERSDKKSAKWHCRWLAPEGETLQEYDSPYWHMEHPFAFKFYPLIDGEIHSFVEDIIDQQRFINRLIVMMDRVLASSAKGVLLFPMDQVPMGVTLDEISSVWAKANGLIPVSGRGRELPRQVVNPGAQDGAYKLLDLQLKMLDNISGVSDALLGRNVSGNMGEALYEAQVKNSTISIADLLKTFGKFVEQRDSKCGVTRNQG